MTFPAPAWVPDIRAVPPHLRPALPIVETGYVGFWRAPRYRWWKGLLAIAGTAAGFLALTTVAGLIGMVADRVDFNAVAMGDRSSLGVWFFLANNVGIALCLPLALVVAWACTGQRPRWLSSVAGGVRWRWLFSLLAVVLPVWVLLNVGLNLMSGVELRWREHTLVMILAVALTTPFQAAAEEYLIRGVLVRAVGSWFRAPVIGFVVSTAVSAAVFMALHGAGDPWLNADYVVFAVVASWVTWRTGGLEAAVAIHIVNNMVGLALAPFTEISGLFDRQEGAGGPWVLLVMGALVLAGVLVEWRWRRRPGIAHNAPGRDDWARLWWPAPAGTPPIPSTDVEPDGNSPFGRLNPPTS